MYVNVNTIALTWKCYSDDVATYEMESKNRLPLRRPLHPLLLYVLVIQAAKTSVSDAGPPRFRHHRRESSIRYSCRRRHNQGAQISVALWKRYLVTVE